LCPGAEKAASVAVGAARAISPTNTRPRARYPRRGRLRPGGARRVGPSCPAPGIAGAGVAARRAQFPQKTPPAGPRGRFIEPSAARRTTLVRGGTTAAVRSGVRMKLGGNGNDTVTETGAHREVRT